MGGTKLGQEVGVQAVSIVDIQALGLKEFDVLWTGGGLTRVAGAQQAADQGWRGWRVGGRTGSGCTGLRAVLRIGVLILGTVELETTDGV